MCVCARARAKVRLLCSVNHAVWRPVLTTVSECIFRWWLRPNVSNGCAGSRFCDQVQRTEALLFLLYLRPSYFLDAGYTFPGYYPLPGPILKPVNLYIAGTNLFRQSLAVFSSVSFVCGSYKFEDVPLLEFMHLVFTRMPAECYGIGLCCCTCVTYFER